MKREINNGDLVNFWGNTMIVISSGGNSNTLTCQYLDGEFNGVVSDGIPIEHISISKRSIIEFI